MYDKNDKYWLIEILIDILTSSEQHFSYIQNENKSNNIYEKAFKKWETGGQRRNNFWLPLQEYSELCQDESCNLLPRVTMCLVFFISAI